MQLSQINQKELTLNPKNAASGQKKAADFRCLPEDPANPRPVPAATTEGNDE